MQSEVRQTANDATDLLEGSLLILPGSGLVALGIYLGGKERKTVLYWTWAFILIGVGVAAMFALSAVGGIGGKSGHSMWWGVLILPYPAGWLMALAGGVVLSGSSMLRGWRRTPEHRQERHANQPSLTERMDIDPKVTLSAKNFTRSALSCAPST